LGSSPARSVAFSRLTLEAQLEVLALPVEESWNGCVALNPHLRDWRRRAAVGRLRATPWPPSANRWLSGPAYAQRFVEIVFGPDASAEPGLGSSATAGGGGDAVTGIRRQPRPGDPGLAAVATQDEFIRDRLAESNLFPLLWGAKE
jgi:hypothetical protein